LRLICLFHNFNVFRWSSEVLRYHLHSIRFLFVPCLGLVEKESSWISSSSSNYVLHLVLLSLLFNIIGLIWSELFKGRQRSHIVHQSFLSALFWFFWAYQLFMKKLQTIYFSCILHRSNGFWPFALKLTGSHKE